MEEAKKLNVDTARSISELQSVIKRFELRSKLYRIMLKARGLEFDAFKEYTTEDDASAIDWKASKRANKVLVRKYREERNLKIVFIVDVGSNMVFGSVPKLKCEYAVEVLAALSHLIINSGDMIGFVLFSDGVKKFVKPKGGEKGFSNFIDNITNTSLYEGASDINKALDFSLNYLDKSTSSVIILSDFLSFNKESEKNLSLLSRKFETLLIMVKDPLDSSLPQVDEEIAIENPSTGQQIIINPRIANIDYEKFAAEKEKVFYDACKNNNIDLLGLTTNEPFVPALANFLKSRLMKRPYQK
ncbi:MAG: DUF58 domain-containing protein [Nanoarchaeota archaeon]|nr:DUF58 domain-containing protein [Nanoarchaeota archaeon]